MRALLFLAAAALAQGRDCDECLEVTVCASVDGFNASDCKHCNVAEACEAPKKGVTADCTECFAWTTDTCTLECFNRGCSRLDADCTCTCNCDEGGCREGCVPQVCRRSDRDHGCGCDCCDDCTDGEICQSQDGRTCECVKVKENNEPRSCNDCNSIQHCSTRPDSDALCGSCDPGEDCEVPYEDLDDECATCGVDCEEFDFTENLELACADYCTLNIQNGSCVYDVEVVTCHEDCLGGNTLDCKVTCEQQGCVFSYDDDCSCDCDCEQLQGNCRMGCRPGICIEAEDDEFCECVECDEDMDCGDACGVDEVCTSFDGFTCVCSPCSCVCPPYQICIEVEEGVCMCEIVCEPGVPLCDACLGGICELNTEEDACVCILPTTTDVPSTTPLCEEKDSCTSCKDWEICEVDSNGNCVCMQHCACTGAKDCQCTPSPPPISGGDDPVGNLAKAPIVSFGILILSIGVSTMI